MDPIAPSAHYVQQHCASPSCDDVEHLCDRCVSSREFPLREDPSAVIHHSADSLSDGSTETQAHIGQY